MIHKGLSANTMLDSPFYIMPISPQITPFFFGCLFVNLQKK